MSSVSIKTGILYIVATPIGNLEDITLRAVRILKEVELIAAEDTRHTRKLLSYYDIHTKLTSYFEHNKHLKGDYIIGRLQQGNDVALVTDAGTPGISDPGYNLIKASIEKGIPVVPIPGACALIAAISASGFSSGRFVFEGFLPLKERSRKERLSALKSETATIIFYESPRRLLSTLRDIHDNIGDRCAAVLKEITKVHEQIIRGRISGIITFLCELPPKGEFVIVLEGSDETNFSGSIAHELEMAVNSGLTMKEAVGTVAMGLNIPRTEVYKESLRIRKSGASTRNVSLEDG